MVWCLVAALGEYKMRDAAVAIGLLFNATVMLMCGPLRKLYLLNKYQEGLQEERSQLANSSQRGEGCSKFFTFPIILSKIALILVLHAFKFENAWKLFLGNEIGFGKVEMNVVLAHNFHYRI